MRLFTPKKLFIYRLIGVILVLGFLIFDFILVVNTPGALHLQKIGERLSHYYSYFTTQSNYIVCIYFIFYLFQSKFKNAKPDFIIRLAVTVYISMTMVVFWAGLFTQGDIVKGFQVYDWITTAVLHTIIPIAMITSYVVTSGDFYYQYERHHKGNYWLIIVYPLLYLLCVLLRGYFTAYDGYYDYLQHPGWYGPGYCFPYFFLDFYQQGAPEMITAGCVLVFVLCTGFQYMYILINNMVYIRRSKKKHRNIDSIQQIKITAKLKAHKPLDYKGKVAVYMNFATSIINIIFAIIFFAFEDTWKKYLSSWIYDQTIVLPFMIIVVAFSFISILFAIMAIFNLYYARVILGFINLAMICFNWVWVIGPILDLIIAILSLSSKKWTRHDYELYRARFIEKINNKPIHHQHDLLHHQNDDEAIIISQPEAKETSGEDVIKDTKPVEKPKLN